MDVERLARAARDLRAEALRYFTLRELLPTEGIVRAATALDEALAATEPAPAQSGVETDVEWLLRQMETQDLATLRGIAKSFPCERNGCFSDKPAQAKQGVRHG